MKTIAEKIIELVKNDDLKPIALVEFLEDANVRLLESDVIGPEIYKSENGGISWEKTHKKLIDDSRFQSQGVPPLIDCGNFILVSSVSPLIRFKYFEKETVCKTIEIPSFNSKHFDLKKVEKNYGFNKKLSIDKAMDLLYLVTKSNTRREYEKNISAKYPKQVNLAIKYVRELFGVSFSPY